MNLKKEIKNLIKYKDKQTRSDLQGGSMVLAIQLAPGNKPLIWEIDNRILEIIDNSDDLTEKQLDDCIIKLKNDIKRYLNTRKRLLGY